MTTAELIAKLQELDPEGTARVLIDDGDYGECAPQDSISLTDPMRRGERCVTLRADPAQMVE